LPMVGYLGWTEQWVDVCRPQKFPNKRANGKTDAVQRKAVSCTAETQSTCEGRVGESAACAQRASSESTKKEATNRMFSCRLPADSQSNPISFRSNL